VTTTAPGSWALVSYRSGGHGPGELRVDWADLPGAALSVTRADPRVWLSNELVEDIAAGRCHPDVSLSGTTVAGSVLTVDGVNRRVAYVLREYLFEPDCWLAEWPD
jgi:hypothetical protein